MLLLYYSYAARSFMFDHLSFPLINFIFLILKEQLFSIWGFDCDVDQMVKFFFMGGFCALSFRVFHITFGIFSAYWVFQEDLWILRNLLSRAVEKSSDYLIEI
jgi:hypothetical protein